MNTFTLKVHVRLICSTSCQQRNYKTLKFYPVLTGVTGHSLSSFSYNDWGRSVSLYSSVLFLYCSQLALVFFCFIIHLGIFKKQFNYIFVRYVVWGVGMCVCSVCVVYMVCMCVVYMYGVCVCMCGARVCMVCLCMYMVCMVYVVCVCVCVRILRHTNPGVRMSTRPQILALYVTVWHMTLCHALSGKHGRLAGP